jgi:hypothetical protein
MRDIARIILALALAALALPACGGSDGNGTGTDADTDSDTDTDADSDTGTGSDTETGSDNDCDAGADDKYQWHTFYGAEENDRGASIAVDSAGNVYVTGWSYSEWLGPYGEAPINPYPGGASTALFVLKLDVGGAYVWHTFFGSWEFTVGGGLATDDAGNVYVSGDASGSWNGPDGESPLHEVEGSQDVFVIKLTADGEYLWHTFYGTTAFGGEINVDGEGNLVVSGSSIGSWDGPGGEGPLHPWTPGYDEFGVPTEDLFVLKLDADGGYRWHTFFGSAGDEWVYNNTVDAADNIYVLGTSGGDWTGPDGEGPLNGYWAQSFVLKLDADGGYVWHLCFPCSQPPSIRTDGNDSLYVVGASAPPPDGVWPGGETPLQAGSGDPGDYNVLVFKAGQDGSYRWHTYYGGIPGLINGGIGNSLEIRASGDPIIAGMSMGSWNGPGGESPLHDFFGASVGYPNVLVLALAADGQYQWHTYYGAADQDYMVPWGSSVGPSGAIYLVGETDASWSGPGCQPPLHAYTGADDAFVLKLAP